MATAICSRPRREVQPSFADHGEPPGHRRAVRTARRRDRRPPPGAATLPRLAARPDPDLAPTLPSLSSQPGSDGGSEQSSRGLDRLRRRRSARAGARRWPCPRPRPARPRSRRARRARSRTPRAASGAWPGRRPGCRRARSGACGCERACRWKPIAKRCASSRTRWTSWSTGEERGSAIGSSRPRTKISSSRFARLRDRLVAEAELLERVDRGPELALAAVDQHEVGQLLALLEQPLVAAAHHLAHRGEVVGRARHALDPELAVVGLLRQAVLEDDHRGHDVGALDVRDVEALDAAAARPRGRAGRAAPAGSPATACAGASTPARRRAGRCATTSSSRRSFSPRCGTWMRTWVPRRAASHASSSSRSGISAGRATSRGT